METTFIISTILNTFKFVDHPIALLWDSLGSAGLYVILMVFLVIIFYKKEKVLEFFSRYLTYAFFVVWTMGFMVYDVGMYPDDCQNGINAFWSIIGVAPMAVIHAFEMFLFQSDVSAIHEGCHGNSLFMFGFSITHLLAAFISLIFVIKHFGFNIVASIIRYWKTHLRVSDVQNLYVFWGMNDATYYLAKDMIAKDKLKDGKIVVIRISNEKENANERIGMERLFSFLSLSKSNLENLQELQKLGCLTTSTFGTLTNTQPTGENDILQKDLRLHSLVRLIRHTTKAVHFFFLENDEVFNIQAVANLRKDLQIKTFVDKDKNNKVIFYCHARYNSIHRVIEDELTNAHIEVKVVDSSRISVELLKKDSKLHPVRYVKIEKDATVSTPFNALVVGFGEVGMDAVRFLYEFGAFVKNSQDKNKVDRSEFCCHVVDQKMNELAGLFNANSPSIAKAHEGQQIIKLHQMDFRSVEFYEKLEEWIKTLNYIVVATGDDESNISLAIRIFRMAIRYRNNGLEQLRILVRIQHDESGHIQKIRDHYNRLWAAEKNGIIEEKKLHQSIITSTKQVNEPLTLFGYDSQVYTYDNVVNESLKRNAKSFKKKYDDSMRRRKQLPVDNNAEKDEWDEEQNLLMQLTGDYQGYAPTFSGLMYLRRAQSQNIANSLHKETKKWLAESALGKDGYEDMLRHGLLREPSSLTYSWKDHSNQTIENVQRVMDVLAQTEHLRWNASHEILGYQMGIDDDGFKDEAKLLHGCLKNWVELKDITKSYDYNIVDVSLDIGY